MKGSKNKNLMILGGYGAAGRPIAKNLLKYTAVDLTIAGRNPRKLKDFVATLRESFPDRAIHASYADATDKVSLVSVLGSIDLLIVATTTPDSITTIAEAALETNTDLLDIFIRGDIVDQLNNYKEKIALNKRRFITQAGFHPGLIAPFIRYASTFFDRYDEANIFMAMDLIVETPESVHELIYEVIEGGSQILNNGKWKEAGYKDAVTNQFSEAFGSKLCYPLNIRELYPLREELGLKNAGAYAAGFNTFIDIFVFTLAMIIGVFSTRLSQKISGRLIFWSIRNKLNDEPKVELTLKAKGIRDDQEREYRLTTYSRDGYDLTALAVLACLNQYFDNTISDPGLYLTGNVVDEKRIVSDLKKMGVKMDETISDVV